MPKIILTRETLVALKPCDLPDRLRKFGEADAMGVREAFDAGFTVADVLWVAGRLGLAQDCARVALFAAKQSAHLNPDSRVAAALEAAQRCIDDPTPAAAAAACAGRVASWKIRQTLQLLLEAEVDEAAGGVVDEARVTVRVVGEARGEGRILVEEVVAAHRQLGVGEPAVAVAVICRWTLSL